MRIDKLRRQAGAPLIFANSDGYITGISDAFREAYGWDAADLVGRPLTTIIPPRFHDAHHLGFARFLTTGQQRSHAGWILESARHLAKLIDQMLVQSYVSNAVKFTPPGGRVLVRLAPEGADEFRLARQYAMKEVWPCRTD